jgi:putative oxidoreductase
MSISRRIARPLLASMFVSGGLDAIRNPESKVKRAEAVTQTLTNQVPGLPKDTVTLIKWNGMAQVAAGALLAIGKFRRPAAVVLIGSIIPTTYAGHRFWEETDDAARAQQRVHFFKNLGLLGGLILAAFDTEGAPSLGWRARRGTRRLRNVAALGQASSKSHTHRAISRTASEGRKARRRAQKIAGAASRRANDAAVVGARQAEVAASGAARRGVNLAVPYVRHANESALGAAKTAVDVAGPYLAAGVERAGEVLT